MQRYAERKVKRVSGVRPANYLWGWRAQRDAAREWRTVLASRAGGGSGRQAVPGHVLSALCAWAQTHSATGSYWCMHLAIYVRNQASKMTNQLLPSRAWSLLQLRWPAFMSKPHTPARPAHMSAARSGPTFSRSGGMSSCWQACPSCKAPRTMTRPLNKRPCSQGHRLTKARRGARSLGRACQQLATVPPERKTNWPASCSHAPSPLAHLEVTAVSEEEGP